MGDKKPTVTYRGLGKPIVITGDVNLVDGQGNPIEIGKLKMLSLCGCGKTKNGVFCDGSHAKG